MDLAYFDCECDCMCVNVVVCICFMCVCTDECFIFRNKASNMNDSSDVPLKNYPMNSEMRYKRE